MYIITYKLTFHINIYNKAPNYISYKYIYIITYKMLMTD